MDSKKLSTAKRRLKLSELLRTDPDLSNRKMASQLGVSESMIRLDRAKLSAEVDKPSEPANLNDTLAAIQQSVETELADLEQGRDQAKIGSKTRLDYSKAIVEIRSRHLKLLQDCGSLGRNIDSGENVIYDFRCYVGRDNEIIHEGGRRQMTREEIAKRDAEMVERQRLFSGEHNE